MSFSFSDVLEVSTELKLTSSGILLAEVSVGMLCPRLNNHLIISLFKVVNSTTWIEILSTKLMVTTQSQVSHKIKNSTSKNQDAQKQLTSVCAFLKVNSKLKYQKRVLPSH